MIPAETSTAKSLLEKPLSQLTEDDIGQITREECRRFLKERGMRRPSWNKSQAIQQVISLKSLLEDCVDPEDITAAIRIRQKHHSPLSPPALAPLHSSLLLPTEASGSGGSAPTPAKDPSPYRRKDQISPVFTVGDAPRLLPAAKRPQPPSEILCPPPRPAADVPAGQLTIFYGGKVNVYQGIPSDKAREIFQLAASPDPFDAATLAMVPSGRSFLPRFTPAYAGPTDRGPVADPGAYPNAPEEKQQRSSVDDVDGGRVSREPVPEGPTSRKASLKRYLAKRKDRYKGRRIIEGSSFSSLELVNSSQKMNSQAQNEHSSMINICSVIQPKSPPCPPLSRY